MPVGKPTTKLEIRALLLAFAGVAVVVLIGFITLRVASKGSVEVRLGDDSFNAGKVSRIAQEIIDRGPVLYSDVSSGDRDIYLNHLSDDLESGWLAFDARPADAARSCTLLWVAERTRFELFRVTRALAAGETPSERCDERTFPTNGAGLVTYPVDIRNGRIFVDLNGEDRRNTQEPATTSSVVESGKPKNS